MHHEKAAAHPFFVVKQSARANRGMLGCTAWPSAMEDHPRWASTETCRPTGPSLHVAGNTCESIYYVI